MEKIGGLDEYMDKQGAFAERKARLLRQGEFYRVGMVHAKAQLQQEVRPDALLHSAMDMAGNAVRSRVDRLLQPTGVSAGAILPYALSIVGFAARRRLLKPALGVVAVAAGLGWYFKRRRSYA